MANPIPALMVVSFKGTGNVRVYKLLTGITLDPVQDGSDVLVGNLEVTSGTNNNHANRMAEAFGLRLLLHGHRIYERDSGGAGTWGEVTGLAQSAVATHHSGLHFLHPDGVPTVAALLGNTLLTAPNTNMVVLSSTDGTTWSLTNTGLDILGDTGETSHSCVYRNSIVWHDKTNDGFEIRMWDFVLGVGVKHQLPGQTGSFRGTVIVHQNNLYAIDIGTGNDLRVWRLDGSVFTDLGVLVTDVVNTSGVNVGVWSDGDDLIVASPGSVTGVTAARVSNLLFGETMSSVLIDSIFSGLLLGEGSIVPYVCTTPSPLASDKTIYFWHRDGNNFDLGSFNLYRWNYRRITHSAVTGGPFQVNEVVTQSVTGGYGVVTDVGAGYLGITDKKGAGFDAVNTLTGADSGATANATSLLLETNVTALGTGIAASHFGLPSENDGGTIRIPTKGLGRPGWDGFPVEVLGGRTKWFFRVYGTGVAFDLRMFFSPVEEAPDQLASLVNGTLIVESGTPATTPTITDGMTIANVTPDDGVALYSFQHDADTDNISEGQGYSARLDIA